MKIGKFKKITAIGLALTMSIGLIHSGNIVSATDENSVVTRKDDPNIVTSKNVVWDEENNEAEITLEAYAKGSVETSSVPLDIVMVLDRSGSMKENGKLATLKSSLNNFVSKIQENAKKYDVDHRVSMIGFASEPSIYGFTNTGLYVDGTFKEYKDIISYKEVYELDTDKKYYIKLDSIIRPYYQEIEYNNSEGSWGYFTNGIFGGKKWNEVDIKESPYGDGDQAYERVETENITSEDYVNSLVEVNQNGQINSNITNVIDNLSVNGGTYPSYGMLMANKVFENNPIDSSEKRQRIVVLFTDGMPGDGDRFDNDEADKTLEQSYISKKTYGANVYTIGYFNNTSGNSYNFLDYVSSNFPNAQAMTNFGTRTSDEYFYRSNDPSGLENIFNNIYTSISGSDLNGNAVISDIITDVFKMPSVSSINTDTSDIKIYTSDYKGKDDDNKERWTDPVLLTEDSLAALNITVNNRAVNISGYDYSSNYVLDKDPTTHQASGQKLIIKIKVKPVDGFIGGDDIKTNGDASGLYSNKDSINENTLVENFDQPDIDVRLKYDTYGKDITIYESTSWNRIEDFFSDQNKIQFSNNRNDSSTTTQYDIDGIRNAYVDIIYKVTSLDGTKNYGTYTISNGSRTGNWKDVDGNDTRTNFDSTVLHSCTDYKITCTVKSINSKSNYLTNDVKTNESQNPVLHILKPTINVNDETIDYGRDIKVKEECVSKDNITWSDARNHSGISENNSVTVKPTLNITVENTNSINDFTDNVFTPQKVEDGEFKLNVMNKDNQKPINPKVINTTTSKTENKFTVHVRSGKLTIQKHLDGSDNQSDSDGNPIFTYKITVKNSLLYGENGSRVFYLYTRNPLNANSSELKDLPVGEWKIEELDTLRYECQSSELLNAQSSQGYSWESNKKVMTISVSTFENKTDFEVKYTNKKKSSDKDSDNDIVVNTFKLENGEIKVGQELIDWGKE